MINKISTFISSEFVKHDIISEDAKNIYKYGIEITVSSIIGFIIVSIIGLLFNSLLQTIMFYFIFIFLRSLTGGYHAKTYLKCNLIFGIITLFVIVFSKSVYSMQISINVITFLFLPSVAIFIWLAPVENINKPIEMNKRVYYKIISVIISVLLYILSILLYINQHIFEASVITMTVFAVSMLCIMTLIQKGGKINGKS